MPFQRLARLAGGAALVALLAACAHPINLEPQKLPERRESSLVAKKVAYVITDADKAREVTTPGGGGDKVSYYPYRDMEKAIRGALRAVYQDVAALPGSNDVAALKASGASYIFVPQISTTSSSPSPFTWPPTKFSTEVQCTVLDPQGATLAKLHVSGNGAAEFDEFKSDFSLAARRSVAEVVEKLAQEIRRSDKLR